MMPLKRFTEFCGCTAQTLRYDDRVGLLKPVRVDDRAAAQISS